jgi:hypothetical protein
MTNGTVSGQNGNGNPAANDYHFDVFLSYSYKPDVKDWVHKKFLTYFCTRLDIELTQLNLLSPTAEERIYVAKREIRPGDYWPDELEDNLRRSKVLVAVCSPHYFISGWCKTEWASFKARAPNLVVPVLYDGSDEYLKPRIDPIQGDDLREFRNFPGARRFQFTNRLDALARNVAARVNNAPSFDPAFPIIRLDAAIPNTPLHRLVSAQPPISPQ